MIFFQQLFRSARVVYIFLYGMIELTIKRPNSRPDRAAWLSVFCNRILRAANITYESHGPVPMEGGVISNHLNFTDILVHSAMRPCVFVSKAELRKVPVLGWISMMAGTQYVERGAGGSARRAGEGMAKGFRDGLPIVFFPEGTTGTGAEPVMPFHSGLLAYTLDAEQPITAAFLHYDVSAGDFAAGRTAQRDIFWGAQGMLNRLWSITGVKHTHISVHFAEKPVAFSEAALNNRKIAAAEAREAVLALAVPLQS